MRIDQVRVVVFRVHRGDRLAESRLAVEDGVPGVVAVRAVAVAGERPDRAGELRLEVVLGRVGEAAVGLSGEKAVRAGLPASSTSPLSVSVKRGSRRTPTVCVSNVLPSLRYFESALRYSVLAT